MACPIRGSNPGATCARSTLPAPATRRTLPIGLSAAPPNGWPSAATQVETCGGRVVPRERIRMRRLRMFAEHARQGAGTSLNPTPDPILASIANGATPSITTAAATLTLTGTSLACARGHATRTRGSTNAAADMKNIGNLRDFTQAKRRRMAHTEIRISVWLLPCHLNGMRFSGTGDATERYEIGRPSC